jgi:hypothetical protein
MKITFISSVVQTAMEKEISFSIAGNNYQKKIIDAINPTIIYSLNFWNNPSKKIQKINVLYFLYPINKLLRIWYLLGFTNSIKTSNNSPLLFYNIDTRNLLTYFICKFIKRQTCYVIVADCNPLKKSIANRLISFALKKADGLLSLSRMLKINKNTIYQELLLSKHNFVGETIQNNEAGSNKEILMSGSLGYTTGLEVALNAMYFLDEFTLHLSGPLFDISEQAFNTMLLNGPSNVIYHGILDEDKYKQLLRKCSICLSLRNPDSLEHLYNFPSKIGEYLQSGKFVLSSIQYNGFENFITFTNWNSKELAEHISNNPEKNNHKDLLEKKYGYEAFKEKIKILIENNP